MTGLNGIAIHISALLNYEFENYSITHYPKAEQNQINPESIWLSVGGVINFNPCEMNRLKDKRVIVQGILDSSNCHLNGFPAELIASAIEPYKAWAELHEYTHI